MNNIIKKKNFQIFIIIYFKTLVMFLNKKIIKIEVKNVINIYKDNF